VLPVRGRKGYEVYAAGMEASAADKAKLLAFVRSGVIAELGCGTGTVLELLRRRFPQATLVGIDASEEMVARCRKRFPGIDVRRLDISRRLFDEGSMDTIVLCSVLHEVFTYNGYDYGAVRDCLSACADALRKGGRLVVRDGLKPARQDSVYLSFLNEPARLKFLRFAREFGSSPIGYREEGRRVHLARRDAMEFLTKYLYDTNWAYEVKEHFGVFTLDDWGAELRRAGLRVVHQESYLIPWLRETHWEKDVRLEVRVRGKFRPTDYPHSTMILAGEK
jgi:SAM-dependent methyltransferase